MSKPVCFVIIFKIHLFPLVLIRFRFLMSPQSKSILSVRKYQHSSDVLTLSRFPPFTKITNTKNN